jgi:hypothetical protein
MLYVRWSKIICLPPYRRDQSFEPPSARKVSPVIQRPSSGREKGYRGFDIVGFPTRPAEVHSKISAPVIAKSD